MPSGVMETPFSDAAEGTSALIWPGETKNRGAGKPSIVTDVPPNISGSGVPEGADNVTEARFDPKMAITEPGATGVVYDAAFTVPAITGTPLVWENAKGTRKHKATNAQKYVNHVCIMHLVKSISRPRKTIVQSCENAENGDGTWAVPCRRNSPA
jgi:hypothetical protein